MILIYKACKKIIITIIIELQCDLLCRGCIKVLISHRVVRCDITFVRGASEEKHPKIISGNNCTIQFSSDDFNTYEMCFKK